MECDPTLSEDVAQLARPWLRERLLQLVMAVPPSWKVTFPAGAPAPGLLAVTVAVKVTDCLNTDGLAEELADVVVPYFTVCVSLEEVLPLKFASPPYDALIEWEPTASVLVTNVAWPEPFRVPVPRVLVPSLKVTCPVGVPEPGLLAVTVAVKVTDCPNTDGLAEELADVVVPYFTVCVSLEEVLPLKFASPPYDALIECEPTASVLVTNVAWPEPFRVPVPRVLEPSLKVTVPVGVPAPGLLAVTVAVKVTDCPDTDGLAEELTSVVVLAFFTVWVSVLEVLPLKVAPPP